MRISNGGELNANFQDFQVNFINVINYSLSDNICNNNKMCISTDFFFIISD